jgi:hypothetical protein
MSESVFFESRGKHAVRVRATGRRVVGKVFWNKATGTAFVADPARGMQRISETEANRVWKEDQARDKGGRPRLYEEPAEAVLLTLPKRLLTCLHPVNKGSLSRNAAAAIERGLGENNTIGKK